MQEVDVCIFKRYSKYSTSLHEQKARAGLDEWAKKQQAAKSDLEKVCDQVVIPSEGLVC